MHSVLLDNGEINGGIVVEIQPSVQKKECCRDNTRALTHDFVSTTSTQKFFKTGYKVLDNASFSPGEELI